MAQTMKKEMMRITCIFKNIYLLKNEGHILSNVPCHNISTLLIFQYKI